MMIGVADELAGGDDVLAAGKNLPAFYLKLAGELLDVGFSNGLLMPGRTLFSWPLYSPQEAEGETEELSLSQARLLVPSMPRR